MERVLQRSKEIIGTAYSETERKYGYNQAVVSIYKAFGEYNFGYITSENGARKGMAELSETLQYSLSHILLDYAVSSFLLNGMEGDITSDDLKAYVGDSGGLLNYDDETSVKVVALAAADNTYWAYNMIVINKKLREGLISSFIKERYVMQKGQELDSTTGKLIKLADGSSVFVGKSQLLKAFLNMYSDEGIDPFSAPMFGGEGRKK